VAYSLHKLADSPIILFYSPPGEDIASEFETISAEMIRLLDAQSVPVFLLLDITHVALGLDDMLRGASLATRGPNPVLRHPRIRECVFVITDPTAIMALRALSSATFGQVKVVSFPAMNEALDYCRRRASTLDL